VEGREGADLLRARQTWYPKQNSWGVEGREETDLLRTRRTQFLGKDVVVSKHVVRGAHMVVFDGTS
jgi:hypothetical protein